MTLDLTQTGTSLAGAFRVIAQNTAGGCVVDNTLSDRELTTGQTLPAAPDGHVGDGTLSFRIIIASFLNGAPVSFRAIIASGLFSGYQSTTTGTLLPRRSWYDVNHNGVPDCDLLNSGSNGECAASSPTTESITWLQLSSGRRRGRQQEHLLEQVQRSRGHGTRRVSGCTPAVCKGFVMFRSRNGFGGVCHRAVTGPR